MQKLIVLTGPTAVGKTDLSIQISKELNGEIISADSAQVYKYLNIGSAKVTKEEMQGVPHHLIDLYEPDFSFDVTVFKKEAMRLVSEIASRGHMPILVGGTGFYIQALLYDISFGDEQLEKSDYRARLEDDAKKYGASALHERLKQIDPVSAEMIHENNVRKVIRALEYYHFHKEPISKHNQEERQKKPAFDSRYFVLTMDRDRLYKRIDQRVDIMKEAGLVEEVTSLRSMGYGSHLTSMQAIGYKEIYAALDLCENNGYYIGSSEYDQALENAFNQIKLNTRHFAKRQLTWFRREKDVIWLDKDQMTDEEIVEFIKNSIK
ncbi:MAG: tRNA (adenosine(37)-N6)-dimethylallyltransferase MiaA [Eubacterium sp.]|nr:tRNA (adenosine(37)-N6)-dimethylallyltransferase MiaA [Eubacterium sp.]